jgi:hypothetical protein
MYAQKMAAAIKVHGKTLREFNELVYLPFGSEYSIYLKNLNTVRASVKVYIDGTDATQGVSLVIDPNDSYDLERFIQHGNLSRGNRFKFIARTTAVEAHRGVKVEDGLVRVVYQFERQPQYVKPGYLTYDRTIYGNTLDDYGRLDGTRYKSASAHTASVPEYLNSASSCAGITAPGSISEQSFQTVSALNLESASHTIILKLVGEYNGATVSKPTTTRASTYCSNCGHRSRSATAKFCSQCGTSLEIIS